MGPTELRVRLQRALGDQIPPTAPRCERRLASVLNTRRGDPSPVVRRRRRSCPYADVRVKTDVPQSVLAYISERPEQFPASTSSRPTCATTRTRLAAQLLGTVGEVSPEQLRRARFRGVKPGTIVGQGGLEYAYDRYLRGRDGTSACRSTRSDVRWAIAARVEPVAGQRLRLSLDLELERWPGGAARAR